MNLKRVIFLLMSGVVLLMPASAQLPLVSPLLPTIAADSVNRDNVVNTALQYLGVRYRKGANGPKYFDCSGFTRFVFQQKNVNLTRCSYTQFKEGVAVEKIADLKPGDLIFFSGARISQTVGHVGIVKELNADSSDVTFVHASQQGVKVDALSSAYYKKRFLGARRVL